MWWVVHVIFYMHQYSDACAGVFMFDHTHQVDKTGVGTPQKLSYRRTL